jgi:hypothetical protein
MSDKIPAELARAFEEAMAKMAGDLAIRAECAAIAREFAAAEADGLRDANGGGKSKTP